MTKEKLMQIYDEASNGIMRHAQAAIVLPEVCETAIELFKIVERQNTQIETYQRERARHVDYVPK